MHVNILDCTLRDGAYLIDKKFGEKTIIGVIKGLVDAKTDIIEIGFFQDDGFGEGKVVFKNSEDAKRFIPCDKKNSMFTVLADYSRYSISNLDKKQLGSVDGIRECFFKHERFDVINAFEVIKENGYNLFIQPVDILGYTDKELIEFIEKVNDLEPYCFSIVDTFGSMYQEDLVRIFEIINHNLILSCKIGFHSHNNLQLSSALSQEFIRLSRGRREVVVDGTVQGMGRGAGNAPTELLMQYINGHFGGHYDVDSLLDIIDVYMDNIRTRCSWGYSAPLFIAGVCGAHVNNISYLSKKIAIKSKDIRYVLSKMTQEQRKRYDYDLLEKNYNELVKSDIDDSKNFADLSEKFENHHVLLIAPGGSVARETEKISTYISENKPVVVSINFVPRNISVDYVYMSNIKRFMFWKDDERFIASKKILTTNISNEPLDSKTYLISFLRIASGNGADYFDNSTLLFLNLMDMFNPVSIAIAGFDGYEYKNCGVSDYARKDMELSSSEDSPVLKNTHIEALFNDWLETRKNKCVPVSFITKSRFEKCLK